MSTSTRLNVYTMYTFTVTLFAISAQKKRKEKKRKGIIYIVFQKNERRISLILLKRELIKMIVESRKTTQGIEYWDTKNKKVLFVPKGQKPSFEVTSNPESMIYSKDGLNPGIAIPDETNPSLGDMDTEQLLAYAKENNVDVPGNMKKADTIREYIKDELAKA